WEPLVWSTDHANRGRVLESTVAKPLAVRTRGSPGKHRKSELRRMRIGVRQRDVARRITSTYFNRSARQRAQRLRCNPHGRSLLSMYFNLSTSIRTRREFLSRRHV